MSKQKVKKIPFGKSGFEQLICNDYYYVDKTKYIEILEDYNNMYQFFLRPRRFGKSIFLSMLECYYDIKRKNKFKDLFSDTYIGKHPTLLKNSYYILKLDFSEIGTDGNLKTVQDDFNLNIYNSICNFYAYYEDVMGNGISGEERFYKEFPKVRTASSLIDTFFKILKRRDLKLYLLIDEYDNFANKILIDKGQKDYEKITHSGGFLKDFFGVVKSGVNSCIDRLFVTGVSPLVLSDVTSGMNVADNISFDDKLNSMIGFNEKEVEKLIDYYISFDKVKKEDKQDIKRIFKAYYNNYCFSEVFKERVYNSNMILYFLNVYTKRKKLPSRFLDASFSSDYSKLNFLVYEGKKIGSNYNKLLDIVAYGSIKEDLDDSFSIEKIKDTTAFISLLYYLGLLTITGQDVERGNFVYEIPNDAVRSIDFEYIKDVLNKAYNLDDGFDTKLNELYFKMAKEGIWKAPLSEILDIYYKYVPLRDGVLKEVALKLFIFSFLIRDRYHFATSEKELNRGYSDIYLETNIQFINVTKYEYIIEFKYIQGGKNEITKEKIEALKQEAIKQLKKYEKDRKVIAAKNAGKIVKKIVIIGSSQKVELMEEI